MDSLLAADAATLPELLQRLRDSAAGFLSAIETRPVVQPFAARPYAALPKAGLGGAGALDRFLADYGASLTASAGPRYLGLVTGGSTPAALAGDWLASAIDQNAASADGSSTAHIERETIAMLRALFGLSDAHAGAFVSGATMANFVGLAQARQWAAKQAGHNIAVDGLYGLPPIPVLSGTPHSCVYKAMSMLGMGKRQLVGVPVQPEREAVDLGAMRAALDRFKGAPCIVVANAGTVNTVDFDDLAGLAGLKSEYGFWLHIDAAFGGFAALSPAHRHLVAGLDLADSIAIDAHKWLNVPYDSAMQFTRHIDLQLEVFQNAAAYLGAPSSAEYVHLTPENSRRFRALPAWFGLMAYGADGHREIVERCCALARGFGEHVAASAEFKLLAPVRMNVVCFTLSGGPAAAGDIKIILDRARDSGDAYFTPTNYQGAPAIRAAFSNWRTTGADMEIAWRALSGAVNS